MNLLCIYSIYFLKGCEALIMEFCFDNKNDFLAFREGFHYYLINESNPFAFQLKRIRHSPSHRIFEDIERAHLDVFTTEFSHYVLSDLGLGERRLAKEIVAELDFAIMRYEAETKGQDYSNTLQRYKDRIPLFPCTFSHDGESTVSLPKEYEPFLYQLCSFYLSLSEFNAQRLTTFLTSRYEALWRAWLESQLNCLARYYRCGSIALNFLGAIEKGRRPIR